MNILIVEDDRQVGDFLLAELGAAGHQCEHRTDGETGLQAALDGLFDVLIVDRMMPKLDGLAMIEGLREHGDNTPVLVLSALGDVDDRVTGLKSGADDYLVKPFSIDELLARVEVLNRRASSAGADMQTTLTVEDLHMNLLQQKVERQGRDITLQPREYKLLEYLMRHGGQVVTRAMLLEHVWGYHFDPQTNVIDVHVSRLRQKIDKDFDKALLVTVRGAGYRLGGSGDE